MVFWLNSVVSETPDFLEGCFGKGFSPVGPVLDCGLRGCVCVVVVLSFPLRGVPCVPLQTGGRHVGISGDTVGARTRVRRTPPCWGTRGPRYRARPRPVTVPVPAPRPPTRRTPRLPPADAYR